MGDERPILDYQQPALPGTREKAPAVTRVVCGIVAVPLTLVAAIGIAGGFQDAMEGMGWGHFAMGCLAAGLAYVMWIPVGLRLLPRRRTDQSH
jgi:hypothetical protein